jgi:hypothetical protein
VESARLEAKIALMLRQALASGRVEGRKEKGEGRSRWGAWKIFRFNSLFNRK